MKINRYMFFTAATATAMLAGCEKDNAFQVEDRGLGMINCESLDVDYIGGQTRATEANGVSVADFTVNFVKQGEETSTQTYKYSQMPEIVTLPAGTYTIQATYGENPDAGWDAPYYFGSTAAIVVKANEVTDIPDAVTCKLSNVKVKINIDDHGLGLVGDDYKVEISVGNSKLNFTKTEDDKTAYFKYVEGSNTIGATFTGTVDGAKVTNTYTFTDAAPGNAYTINFTVTKPENVTPGDINIGEGSINIDTEVVVKDETVTANPDETHDDIIEGDRNNDREATGSKQ